MTNPDLRILALADAKFVDGALHGALAALHDPYSVYYDATSWRQFTHKYSAANGFVGVGLSLAPVTSSQRGQA